MQKLTPEFAFMKGISIRQRVQRILLATGVGFLLQIFVLPLLGWFAILAAALMGRTQSKTNKPEVATDGDWQTVTIEELSRAKKLLDTTSEVRSSSGAWAFGCLTALGAAIVAVVLLVVVDGGRLNVWSPVVSGGSLSAVFTVDVLTFWLGTWLGGGAKPWEPPKLRTKFDQLRGILAIARQNPQLEFEPSLQLSKGSKGAVPTDIKLMVKIKDAPPNFVGIQVQTSFNNVQGKSYPYTYCVLLAKPEFALTKRTEGVEIPPKGGFPVGFLGLFADDNMKRESKFARFHGSLVELKKEGEVDIAVVRQDTSQSRVGYTTTPEQALEVFSDAYVLAKKMLGQG